MLRLTVIGIDFYFMFKQTQYRFLQESQIPLIEHFSEIPVTVI
jgi:hypothetical protein